VKLKTALELLGDDRCRGYHGSGGPMVRWCDYDLELVARRAREEAYEMAAELMTSKGDCNLGPEECERCEWEADKAKAIRALPTEPAINQCDGCRAGHPVSDGIHRPAGSKPWDGQAMACTRDRYEGPQGDDWEVGIDNDDRDTK